MSKRPTHNLCITRRDAPTPFQEVGVAWMNDKGQLNIVLRDGVVLDWRIMETHRIMLFEARDPTDSTTSYKARSAPIQPPMPDPAPNHDAPRREDDLPF